MGRTLTLKDQCIVEFLDAGLLIFFDIGYVATLKAAGASFGQREINVIWSLGVAMAAYLTARISDAHLNPAVTIALWLFACFDDHRVVPFITSQFAGASYAAALVYGLYYDLFLNYETTHRMVRDSVEGLGLVGIFSTYSNPHINFVQAFTVGIMTTAILMGVILALTDDGNDVPRGPLAPLLIGLLIAVIGASMEPLTGFTVNLVCDIGPEAFTWLAGWGDVTFIDGKDIPCFLMPPRAPAIGATLGTFSYHRLIDHHLSCDTCMDEGQRNPSSSTTQYKASL